MLYWKKRAETAWSTWRGCSFLASSFALTCCSFWLDLMRASLGEIIFFATANLRVFLAFPMVAVDCVFFVILFKLKQDDVQ